MADSNKVTSSRRTYLKAATGGLGIGIAGCLGDDDEGGDIELLTWNLSFLENSIEGWMDDWRDEFGDEYPNIDVTWTDQGGDEILPYYESGLQGGDPSAVIDMEFGAHATFAEDGLLADMEELVDQEFLNRFSEASVELGMYNGEMVAAPFYLNSQMTTSRMSYFEEAGLEPPTVDNIWSTDEYLDNAETLVNESDAEFGLLGLLDSFVMWSFFFSEGINILTEDATSAAFNTDRAVEILGRMADLTDDGVIPEVTWTGDFEETGEQFAVGDTAMGLLKDSSLRLVEEQGEDWVDEDSLVIGPAPEGGNFAEYHTWSVTATDHTETQQQAAADLISVILNQEWQEDFLRETTVLVPHEEAVANLSNDPEYREERPLLAQIYDQFNALSDDFSVLPIVPELAEVEDIMEAELANGGLGEKSPEEALDDAESRVNSALE